METRDRKFAGSVFSSGSALILAVVLTSILAIVGVLFVMMARVDKVATSAISENKELNLAIDTIIAEISQQLVSDVPGVVGQEYYDYPLHTVAAGPDGQLGTPDDLVIDPGADLIPGTVDDIPFYQTDSDPWLSTLEPRLVDCYETPLDNSDDLIGFSHITDLYGRLAYLFQLGLTDLENDRVSFRNMRANIIAPTLPIRSEGDKADADGDGVTDSRWIIIPNMTSSKGKPIHAAIRAVDNQAMLNVNAAWKFEFDPNVIVDANRIDGSSQLQINLMALANRPYDPATLLDETNLLNARANYGLGGLNPLDLEAYKRSVIWQYPLPIGSLYTPFDISDELELRNRFVLDIEDIDSRIEDSSRLWTNAFTGLYYKNSPYKQGDLVDDWFERADKDLFDPCDIYSYRHIATTYNMDRIIDPMGGRMINVNNGNTPVDIPYQRYTRLFPFPFYPLDMNTPVGILYDRLLSSLGPVIPDPNIAMQYAQLAVNIVDFSDDDDINNDGVLDFNCVTTLVDPYDPCIVHYGLEAQPFINELAWKIGASPSVTPNYFALELYNPFNKDIDLGDFVLEFVNRNDPADQYFIAFPAGQLIEANSYFVIVNANVFSIYTDPNKPTAIRVDPALRFFEGWISSDSDRSRPPIDRRPDPDKSKPPIPQGAWGSVYDMSLLRSVLVPVPGTMIYVDNQIIDSNLALLGSTQAHGRDDRDWRVIYQTLREDIYAGSLGMENYLHIPAVSFPTHLYSFFLPNPLYTRAKFVTVGDIPRLLTLGHGITRNSTIGRQLMAFELLEITAGDQEYNVRLDLQNPFHRNVFQYLTVFDPTRDFIDNDSDGLGTDLDSDGFLDIYEADLDEVKIPGRININTAPWYVIAQLPWMTNEIAQAIVAYRDKLALELGVVDYSTSLWGPPDDFKTRKFGMDLQQIDPDVREEPGFASIGELLNVTHNLSGTRLYNPLYDVRKLSREAIANDLAGFPDLTTYGPGLGDGIADDFEERDVIFSRISNLVSVRSDVFTAYILVRIGADGPQKRVIAILDRSGVNKTNVNSPDGKVRIVALQHVPDPR